jgi:ATP-binding protein involved in chromosome partitioning
MPLNEQTIVAALARVTFPGFSRNVVELGVVRDVRITEGAVTVNLELAQVPPPVAEQLRGEIRRVLESMDEVNEVRFGATGGGESSPSLKVVGTPPPRPSVAASGGLDARLIPQVRHTIAVASGKGGVGKSTVAVNLAVALARSGARTGLLDADIYGPSIPLMTGLSNERPVIDAESQQLRPFERFGVRLMSLGFLMNPEDAVIWRGPMVMKAIEQLLRDVAWGELDVLIVDMPPGTGDAQLTLSQRVSLSGAVIVTTPQDVALADAIKGVTMFRKVGVPVLGIIENMSYFSCPHCQHRSEIFGHGGGKLQAERLGVPFLGEVPLDTSIRSGGDAGEPIAVSTEENELTRAFMRIAAGLIEATGSREDDGGSAPRDGGGLFERFGRIWRGAD